MHKKIFAFITFFAAAFYSFNMNAAEPSSSPVFTPLKDNEEPPSSPVFRPLTDEEAKAVEKQWNSLTKDTSTAFKTIDGLGIAFGVLQSEDKKQRRALVHRKKDRSIKELLDQLGQQSALDAINKAFEDSYYNKREFTASTIEITQIVVPQNEGAFYKALETLNSDQVILLSDAYGCNINL